MHANKQRKTIEEREILKKKAQSATGLRKLCMENISTAIQAVKILKGTT